MVKKGGPNIFYGLRPELKVLSWGGVNSGLWGWGRGVSKIFDLACSKKICLLAPPLFASYKIRKKNIPKNFFLRFKKKFWFKKKIGVKKKILSTQDVSCFQPLCIFLWLFVVHFLEQKKIFNDIYNKRLMTMMQYFRVRNETHFFR